MAPSPNEQLDPMFESLKKIATHMGKAVGTQDVNIAKLNTNFERFKAHTNQRMELMERWKIAIVILLIIDIFILLVR